MKRFALVACVILIGIGFFGIAQENLPAPCGEECMAACRHIQHCIDESLKTAGVGYAKELMGAEFHRAIELMPISIVYTVEYMVTIPFDPQWHEYICFGTETCKDALTGSRLGIREIDVDRLIPAVVACDIAVREGGCPWDFGIETITLYWYVTPVSPEPIWTFVSHEGQECRIGAYTGHVYKRCVDDVLSAGVESGGILLTSGFDNLVPINGELAWFIHDENPTTGYTWRYRPDNSGVYALVTEFFLRPSPPPGVTGVPGAHVWIFEALNPWTGSVLFELSRPGEPPVEVIGVRITGVPE